MKKILFLTIFSLSGCQTVQNLTAIAPPTETSIDGKVVTINVPKGINSSDSDFKGIFFQNAENSFYDQSGNILKYTSFNFQVVKPNELEQKVCKGEQMRNGQRYQSCIYLDSKFQIVDKHELYQIDIKPYRIRSVQGRDAIYLPIGLPKLSIDDWYSLFAKQRMSFVYKMTSTYSPESIKGNFDRKLERLNFERSSRDNAALRQYKDTYKINVASNVTVRIGASFYPYKNGTLVETYIDAESISGQPDWNVNTALIKSKLDQTIND